MIRFFFILSTALLFGCNGDKYSNKEIRRLLFEKYRTEFEVYDNWYHFELGHHVFTARSRENRYVVAYGAYGAKGRPVHDNYPQTLHSRQALERAFEILSRHYERVLVRPNITSRYEHISGSPVVDLKSILAAPDVHQRSSYRVFIFDTFDDSEAPGPRARRFRGILALINAINENPGLDHFIAVEFWETRLSNSAFAEIRREFERVGDSVLRNPERNAGEPRRILRLEFQSSPDLKINADALFDAMEPTAKGLRVKTTRF